MTSTAPLSTEPQQTGDRAGRGGAAIAALLFSVGLAARLAPLLDVGGRLFRQFPTEDGYLMLTIARNVALGKGMSVADGLQPTNGTQPLATLLWAGVFWLAGGDREHGVLGVLLLEVALSCGAALLLYLLARRLLRELPHGESAALLLSSAWFAAPLVVMHSMNCLETGLYAAAVVAAAIACADSPQAERWSAWRCLGIGALLGLTFWTRNDAVFLVLAACLLHVGWGLFERGKPLSRRISETFLFGATSVAVASPWLVFNQIRFGAIVPVSGQSEALEARFAENILSAPNTLFEYATLYLPIPGSLEQAPWVILFTVGTCALVAVLVVRVLRTGSPAARAVTALGVIFGLCVVAFYGLTFGAGYFFSRYVFPISPFLALLWGAVLRRGWELANASGWKAAPPVVGILLVAFAVGLDARLYRNGSSHLHFQVVEWVRQNVPDDAWVAAPQSGTLGFFHDRTINLDGKVNPAALAARRVEGGVARYLVERREIEYLADWEGLAIWAKQPLIGSQFELVVDDLARNLAVLRRRDHASN